MVPALDPDMAAFVGLLQSAGIDPTVVSIEAARQGARALRLPWNRGGPVMHGTREGIVAGLRCRVHFPRPVDDKAQPFTLYLHGGGWTLLDIDTHDDLARRIADASAQPVLLVDYPRAPENPFPVPLKKLQALLAELRGTELAAGLDPMQFVLSGDSAGANLALALLLAQRDAKGVTPKAVALLYGCFAPTFDTPSHRAYGTGELPLTTARMRWFWDNYVPNEDQRRDTLAVPLKADLAGLPPVFLAVAQHDVLFDENMELASRLATAGVDLTLRSYPGTIHGFAEAAGAVGAAVACRALGEMGGFIAAHIEGGGAMPVHA